jgi:adenylate kinase family enzyme
MPQYLNLKLCFIGYAFAGKKTQAKILQDNYGLHTYQMSDLVSEAVNFYESNPNPIEFIKK